jgi:hypothetical protein
MRSSVQDLDSCSVWYQHNFCRFNYAQYSGSSANQTNTKGKRPKAVVATWASCIYQCCWQSNLKVKLNTVWPCACKKLSHGTPQRRLRGEEVQLLLILYLGIKWGWVVSVTPRGTLAPGIGPPVPEGPRAGLDTEVRGKIASPLPGIEPRSPGRPVRIQTL